MSPITRRTALKYLTALGGALLLPTPRVKGQPLPTLLGESLTYKVSFLFWEEVGTVTFSFKRDGDGPFYLAQVNAQTKGFIARLAGNPRFWYQSHMEMTPWGRLRTVEFIRIQERNGIKKETRESFDYREGVMVRRDFRDDRPYKVRRYPIPPGAAIDDFVTAFYNFRLQAYGQVRPGTSFEVATVPRKGERSKIFIKVEEQGGDLLALVNTDQEIFGTRGSPIKLLLNRQLIPTMVTVTSVLGLGDAVGRLKDRKTET